MDDGKRAREEHAAAVKRFLEDPRGMYASRFSPLAASLWDTLDALEARGTATEAAVDWDRVRGHFRRVLLRTDLLMERARQDMTLTPGKRAAFDAEQNDVRISGSLVYFTMVPDATKLVLDNARIVLPTSGTTVLAREEGARLLILAASAACFPPAAGAAGFRRV